MVPDFAGIAANDSLVSNRILGVAILSLLLILLLSGRVLFPFFEKMFGFINNPVGVGKMKKYLIFDFFLIFSLLICSPIVSLLSVSFNILPYDFSRIAIVIFSYFIIRSAILYIIPRITSGGEIFGTINRLSISFFVIMTAILLLFSPFLFIQLSSSVMEIVTIVMLSCISVLVLYYLFNISQIIFSSHISLSFSFLYLCTLEILPVCLIVTTLVKH